MTNNLNVRHSVTLTEGQISVILYHLEGKDGEEINSIFQTLEGTIDSYYDRQSEAKSNKNVSEICADTSYATPEITTSKVIITPDEYDTTKYEEFVHDSECC